MKTSKNILTALLLTGSAAVPALSQTVTTKPRIQANAPRSIVIAETEAPPVIRTGLLQSTLILLPAEEKVATVFGGDTSSWVFDGGHVASRFISIKPKVANSTTDVHIVSDHGKLMTASMRKPTRKTETETNTIAIHADSSNPSLVLERFIAWLMGNASPRLVMVWVPYWLTDWPVRDEIQPAPQPSTPAPNRAPNRPGIASWKRPPMRRIPAKIRDPKQMTAPA